MTSRALTETQKRRLLLCARGFVSTSTATSMPSLARRGLVEKYWHVQGGRRYSEWRITDAGRREAARIEAERANAKAAS